jgi:enterochelin esterase-like enzyme
MGDGGGDDRQSLLLVGAAALKHHAEGHATPSPALEGDLVVFRLPDPDRLCHAVRLRQEISRPRSGPPFEANGSAHWHLRWAKPPVGRFQYAFEVAYKDGRAETICDPGNPLTATGPFGEVSVVELPGYRPPDWLESEAEPGSMRSIELRSPQLRRSLEAMLWTAPGARDDEPLPLLVAHDGPELARFSSLIGYLAHLHGARQIPPLRAALLAPIERDENYSASTRYARALAHDLLPSLNRIAPVPRGRSMRVGMGASLGALAMLHVHRLHPESFGALFLQSGSFFRSQLDRQESAFPRFVRICRFIGRVTSATDWVHPVPISMTCGSVEENLGNNRLLSHALRGQGYAVTLAEHPDAHNWVAWRDTFDPHLDDLLTAAWS